jgi:hypothetical protein
MPEPAPVMTATLPFNDLVMLYLSQSGAQALEC